MIPREEDQEEGEIEGELQSLSINTAKDDSGGCHMDTLPVRIILKRSGSPEHSVRLPQIFCGAPMYR